MSTELIWFQISTKLVGMQELFQALPRAIENGRCDDFRIGTRVSRAAFGGATRNSLARVDYSLEIAAVKEIRDREDAITEREMSALARRRDRERQLDPASLLLWLLC